MSNFQIYFPTGFTHILDFAGIDHILFVATLCLGNAALQWKKLFWLITAFTIGHSISLALSTLQIIVLPQALTELFIAITILITAVYNIINVWHAYRISSVFFYIITLSFGCIHGLGFSSLLLSLLGHEQSILGPLFFFNIGLEAGQMIIICVILLLNYLLTGILRLRQNIWQVVTNTLIAIVAITMIISRISF